MAVTRYVRSRIKVHVQANEVRPEGSHKERNQTTFTFSGQSHYDMEPDELAFYVYFGFLIMTYGGDFPWI